MSSDSEISETVSSLTSISSTSTSTSTSTSVSTISLFSARVLFSDNSLNGSNNKRSSISCITSPISFFMIRIFRFPPFFYIEH